MGLGFLISRILDKSIGFLAALGAVVILFTTVIVCWEVAVRFFLGYGVGWALEISEYSLLWFTLLASAWVLKRDRHVKIDIVLLHLTPEKRNIVNLATSILAAAACLVIVWASGDLIWKYIKSGERLPTEVMPPKFLPYLIIPIGFAFLFLQFVRRIKGYWNEWKQLSTSGKG